MISLAGYSLSSHYTQKFPAVEKETNRHHSTELLFHPERKNKKIFFPIPSPLHHSGGIKETHTHKNGRVLNIIEEEEEDSSCGKKNEEIKRIVERDTQQENSQADITSSQIDRDELQQHIYVCVCVCRGARKICIRIHLCV